MLVPTLFGCKPGTESGIVVVGIPYDHGATVQYGASKSPAALRFLTSPLKLEQGKAIYVDGCTTPIVKQLSISDFGDIKYSADQQRNAYLSNCENTIHKLLTQGKVVLVLGGDHTAALPTIRAHARIAERFQIVHIDAHTDFAPISDGNAVPTHANFMSYVSRLANIERIIQIGVRAITSQPPQLPTLFKAATMATLRVALIPKLPAYLTIDTDGFDPYLAPAVGFPEPGGLNWTALEEVLTILSEMQCNLIGADWCEYNPVFDSHNNITGIHIARSLLKLIEALHNLTCPRV